MELTESLKSTLENTYGLALKLEEVSSMIVPKKIGERGRKRLLNINRELKNYTVNERKNKIVSQMFRRPLTQTSVIMGKNDNSQTNYTSSKVKKNLSVSIKEVNQRVKLSRAGKHSVAKCMTARRSNALNETTLFSDSSPSHFLTDTFDEKPQPYISLTNGKIEDPVTLPTYEEFLQSKGEEFNMLKGKDELFYRIDKATEQINRFKDLLKSKNFGKNFEEKMKMKREPTKAFKQTEDRVKIDKKNDLKALMNQYFHMPCLYDSPKSRKSGTCFIPSDRRTVLSSEAEEALESTMKNFNLTKAVENRKILDILDKINVDRPNIMKRKIKLIQSDKEKYKNKLRSIEKFNFFRDQVEKAKRDEQYKIYQQGLVYLEILDEFKRRRHNPGHAELVILAFWKRVVEAGCLITHNELHEVASIIAPKDIDTKDVQILIDKFASSINV